MNRKMEFLALIGVFCTGLGSFAGVLSDSFETWRRLVLLSICCVAFGLFWYRIKQVMLDTK